MHVKRRPLGVWIVCGYFAASIGATIVSLVQLLEGEMSLTPAQRAYFDALGPTDYLGGAATLSLSTWAAIELFRLRRRTVPILASLLALNIAASVYHLVATNWTDALGMTGVAGVAAALSLLAIIVVYSWWLDRRGVLS
jgi:hypothetical protein